ncbi:RNA polymerase sigma-70 factor [Dysgonomonas capnocytophagoides]|uniref:RNA polymerase sigma-70 factor n=1 Tax=Dysgonomonas capnocytophagoides TaxID=45254 RepID=UPI0033428561
MERREEIHTLLLKLEEQASERHFKQLYNLLYDRFFRISFYYLQNDENTQEVVLDVFLSLWNKRKDLHTINNFENYCFILLKNASLNYLSKHKNISERIETKADFQQSDPTPEENLLNEELLLVYINTLEELPPRCREIFILIREQELSYKEVAEQLNISPKTVDAQIQKAVSTLKEKIKLYFS